MTLIVTNDDLVPDSVAHDLFRCRDVPVSERSPPRIRPHRAESDTAVNPNDRSRLIKPDCGGVVDCRLISEVVVAAVSSEVQSRYRTVHVCVEPRIDVGAVIDS